MSRKSKVQTSEEQRHRDELIQQLLHLGEVVSTETALFHQAAAESVGLGITDMKALSVLISEGAMTAGEIGDRLGLTSGSVTSLIDRLESKQLVMRQPHEKDRRKVVVTVNFELLNSVANPYESIGEAFQKLLVNFSTDELEFLVSYQKAILEITKNEIAQLGTFRKSS